MRHTKPNSLENLNGVDSKNAVKTENCLSIQDGCFQTFRKDNSNDI